ncbi:MAG: putative Ig domain-containing protein [Planctomycetes bacterium]|nr:putative Ig domain-containing protein [Planctomycetota bacterium]
MATLNSSYSTQVNGAGGTVVNAYSYDDEYQEYYYICSGYAWSISAGSLPLGISLSRSNGSDVWYDNGYAYHNGFLPGQAILSGTPTQAGTYNFTVTVTDYANNTAAVQYTLIVDSFMITTTSLPGGNVNMSYNANLTASGGTAPRTWSITAGALPGGLSLNANNGAITGTPSATGASNFTAKITDANNNNVTRALSISIAPEFYFTTTAGALPNANLNNAYSTQANVIGGTAVNAYSYDDEYQEYYYICSGYVWSVSAGSLPPGLSLSQTNGSDIWYDNGYAYHNGLLPGQAILSGTPTVNGAYTFTLQATDYPGVVISRQFSITVYSLNITTSSLVGGNVNMSYAANLIASGGTTPYTWSITVGTLPGGLSLNANNGAITGTPSTTGASNFTVKVTDANNNNITKALSISIAPEFYFITTAGALTKANINNSYTTQINVTGGTAVNAYSYDEDYQEYYYICSGYAWSVSAGSLPSGISLSQTNGSDIWYDNGYAYHNGFLPGQAILSGTPTQAGTYNFTLQSTDYLGIVITREFSILVYPLYIETNTLPPGNKDNPYTVTLTASGGATPYNWTITAGNLPAGISLAQETGIISGTSTVIGTFNFTVKVTAADNDYISKALSVNIGPAFYYTTNGPFPHANLTISYETIISVTGGTPYEAYNVDEMGWEYRSFECSGYMWNVSAGSLPPGIGIGSTNGSYPYYLNWYDQGQREYNGLLPGQAKLIGTPTQAGTYNFTLRATEYPGCAITRDFSITVDPIIITTDSSLPYIRKDESYTRILTVSGGPTPYTWSINQGSSLPPGLSMSEDGIITGIPTVIGFYNFTIRVTASDGTYTWKEFTIEVKPSWEMLSGGNHLGQDWTPSNNDTIGGEHYGINNFTVPQGATVHIQTGSGMKINASAIEINGTFKADSRGVLELISYGNLNITVTGIIDLTDLDYGGTDTTTTQGGDATVGTSGGGGGGYGGAGGAGNGPNAGAGGGTRGTVYYKDIEEGAKGGNVPYYAIDPYGGMGGKAILSSGGEVTINGKILAYGNSGQDGTGVMAGGGGGSGGGILIDGDKVKISGTAQLFAYGGIGGSGVRGGGGGGGGRVKIFADTLLDLPDGNTMAQIVNIAGGTGGNPNDPGTKGQDGTKGTFATKAPNGGYCSPCEQMPNGSTPAQSGGSSFNLTSGNINIDLSITGIVPANSLPHNITLFYNSSSDETAGTLGAKWTHTFNMRIRPVLPGQTLFFIDESGKTTTFDDQGGDNVYTAYQYFGDYTTITDTGNGYVMQTKDRTVYNFNANGQFIQIQDLYGNTVVCNYTGANMTGVVISGNRTIQIAYNIDNRISQITDPAGNQTNLAYTNGLLTEVSKDNGNWKWRFTYNAGTALIATKTDPSNDVTMYAFNTFGKLTGITKTVDGVQKTKSVSYDAQNPTAAVTDFDGSSITAEFDGLSNTWSEYADALGNATNNTFDNSRNLLSKQLPSGAQTTFTYDDRGNILTETSAIGCVTTFRYEDPNNSDNVTMITDARNISRYLEYNAQGSPVREIDAIGTAVEQENTYEYWPDGKIKAEHENPSGLNLTVEYYYTNGYMTTKVQDPAGLNIRYETEYDSLGRQVKSFDPRDSNIYSEFAYDYRGNMVMATGPAPNYTQVKYEFDLMDRMKVRLDDYGTGRENIRTEYSFDNLGRPVLTTIDPLGLNISSSTEYYADNKVKKTTDPEGAITEYAYLANGWTSSVSKTFKDTGTAVTSYTYFPNGNQASVTDPEGHTTYYTYTLMDKLETTTDAEGNVTTYVYEDCGCCSAATVIDPEGNATFTKFDELKRPKYTRSAEANITTAFVYDSAGRRTQTIGPWYDTNQNGIVDTGESSHPTEYEAPVISYAEYDKAGRVVSGWANSHAASQVFYDKADNQIKTIDVEGLIMEYEFNEENRLVLTKVDPLGVNEQSKYFYNRLGRQVQATAAYGTAEAISSFTEYDKIGRVTTSYTADPQYAGAFQYNKRGQQTQVTDANGKTSSYEYYLDGQLKRTTNANLVSTDYDYNKDGLRTTITYYRDSNPVNTCYTYFNNHQLKTTDYPGFGGLRNVTTNSYWQNGALKTKTDPKGQTISFSYDGNGRLTAKTYPDLTEVNRTYDAQGNVLTTTDTNTDSAFDYDDIGRLAEITDNMYTPAKTLQYSYREDGLRTAMTEPEGDLVEYSYNAVKRLTAVKRNGVTEGAYEYNKLGLRTKLIYGNGAYAEYQYQHPQKWLTALNNKKSDGTVISSFAYTHDNAGNRMTMALAGGDLLTYTYDNTYQLTSETRTVATPYQIAWTYDEVGNRLTQNKNGVQSVYTYNDANQLLTETTAGVQSVYEYDANGNQVKKTKGADVFNWTYNYNNQMTAYDDPVAANDAVYTYNAGGARIVKTLNGVTEKYVLDGANVIADYDGNNVLQATYLTPFLDQNLVKVNGTGRFYYMQDGLGSTRNIINSVQVIVNMYDYSAFGESLVAAESVLNRYRYTGRELDGESQTYYYRTREYTPANGRFGRRDSIGYRGGIDLYGYVKNNPAKYTDPSGLLDVAFIENRGLNLCGLGPFETFRV